MNNFIRRFWPHIAIVALSFLIYGNTLSFDYTLDDAMVIKENTFTQQGLAGLSGIFSYDSFTGFFGIEKKLVVGGRYRPLSIATFALEYEIVGGFSPFLSHLINIFLYAITGILIYLIVKKLSKGLTRNGLSDLFPILTALVFIAHPVHTEVVANIKGRDEILAFLFSLLSLWMLLKNDAPGRILPVSLAAVSLFLGLLSKENAIAFVVIIPLTLWFFSGFQVRRSLTVGAVLSLAALLFIFIRFLVLGYIAGGKVPDELLNNPFLQANTSQKFGTILMTMGIYLRLLLFPVNLTHDYYPYHIPLVSLSDPKAIIPLFIYIALVTYAIIKLPGKNWFSYSIWLYLLPLIIVSNIIFPVGTFMNERFIYMSSLGACIAVTVGLTVHLPAVLQDKILIPKIVILFFLSVTLLFSVLTIKRNRVWKDNFTLFTHDVHISENSIKCNIAAGGEWMKNAEKEPDTLLKKKKYEISLGYLTKAIGIYPKATNGLLLYGNALATYKKDYKQAINQYFKILTYNPYDNNAIGNSIKVLNSMNNTEFLDYKISVFKDLWNIQKENAEINYILGKLYGQYKANIDSSLFFLERAVQLNPGDVNIYKDLGIVYSLKQYYSKALETFETARKLDPADQSILQNIQITKNIMKRAETP